MIEGVLRPLIGLQLSIAHRAADMRGFHFGRVKITEKGYIGEYALHIQCSWRIEGSEGIVTGQNDIWNPVKIEPGFSWESWNYEQGNLQDHKIQMLFQHYDASSKSSMNKTNALFVEKALGDEFGGVAIWLSDGYCLRIFPTGSASDEDWRIFKTEGNSTHFVIAGGKLVE